VQQLRIPSLDTKFVARWTPARFAAAGLVAYAILVCISPLEYDYSVITVGATLYALAVFAGFFGGCHVAQVLGRSGRPAGPERLAADPDLFINLTAGVGAVGVVARIYDRVVLRNFSIGETLLQTRESLTENVSIFGYLGGAFFSFGAVSLLLIWLSSSQQRRPAIFVFAILLTLYPAAESLLQGSRSSLLHVAFITFIFARSSKAMPWLVRSPWALAATGMALAAVIELVYELRSLQGIDEMEIADLFKLTAIGEYAHPPQWIMDELIATGGRGLTGGTLKVWTHFTQYLTHSWIVYFINFQHFEDVFGWGRLHLYMPMRIVSALLGEDVTYDPALYGMEPGVSPTAISLVQYDFGAAGPLMAMLFGMAATVVHRRAIAYPERWLPLNAYLCFASLTLMIDNELLGGSGGFAVWTFGLYVPLHYGVTLLSQRTFDTIGGAGIVRRPREGGRA
jgi:hypothetical protein